MANVKVEFDGLMLWWITDDELEGALAPLNHCDEEGEIADLETALFLHGDSYAHVFEDGRIMRYGRQIGTRNDLVRV